MTAPEDEAQDLVVHYGDVVVARRMNRRVLSEVVLRLAHAEIGSGRLAVITGDARELDLVATAQHRPRLRLIGRHRERAHPYLAMRPPDVPWLRHFCTRWESLSIYVGPETGDRWSLIDSMATELVSDSFDADAILAALHRHHGGAVHFDCAPASWSQAMVAQHRKVGSKDKERLLAKLARLGGAP